MGQEITKLEAIPLPSADRPAMMPSLPEWVASLVASAKRNVQPDQAGKYREVSTLPADLLPNAAMKEALTIATNGLGRFLAKTPLNDLDSEKATLVVITKMLRAIPGQKSDEFGVEAIGEAYLEALDDVPSWAVREALRKWHRGEHGDEHDYRWRPAPAVLRNCAIAEAMRIKARITELADLVNAEPLKEFSDEHCSEMRGKLVELFKGIRKIA